MDKTKVFGDKGEEIACEYLISKGYKLLNRNWYFNKKEIDIICVLDDLLIIVEVKTRSTEYYGKPEDSVTLKKQSFLIEATQNYIEINNLNLEVRFDVVSVIINEKVKINHIINAFKPQII